ncbi:MAG: cell surface protein SprA [Candidatus Eisenbacteria bacterium]
MRVREAVASILLAALVSLWGLPLLMGRFDPAPARASNLLPGPPCPILSATLDPSQRVAEPLIRMIRSSLPPAAGESLFVDVGNDRGSGFHQSADSSVAPTADILELADSALAPTADILGLADSVLAPSAAALDLPDSSQARSDSVSGERVPAGRGVPYLIKPMEVDPFGIVALWRASTTDTATVEPLAWWPDAEPMRGALLYRLYRRASSRAFARDRLGLRPEFFASSDSIAIETDANADSLIEAGVASGVFFQSSRSGGMRYLPPPGRDLSRSALLTWQHSVDLERAVVQRSRLRLGLEVGSIPPEPYARHLTRLSWVHSRSVWREQIKESMKRATVQGGRAGLVRLSLPFELPTVVRSIFGEGKPNLSVSGSERISFGGRSQWYPFRPTTEFQRKPSKFPQLEMKQDLTIRLKGDIGDKLDVDVDQSSQAQTSLANRIGIHYRGYEDEIIRKVDLGNTSLRLPGTEYVSYGGSHTGLFGINAEAQVGDVTFNVILSKEEGETAEKSTSVRSQEQTKTIHDYEYVKDRFFFLNDPNGDAYPETGGAYDIVQISQGSVILYLDDGDGDITESFATYPGHAVLNLDGPAPQPSDTLAGPCYFQQLDEGPDYEVLIDERNQTHPIIILKRYLDQNSTLGVIYYDQGRGSNVGGVVGDQLYVKMIRPRYDLVGSDLESGPWAATNRLMLKNVYPLHSSLENWTGAGLPENAILKDGFDLQIRYKGAIGGIEDPDELDGTRLIRSLGLDYYQETDAGLVLGQDSQIDNVWVDFTNGYLFFPDLRPFAPAGPDGEADLRGRPGNPSTWDVLAEERWNTDIYERRSCVRDHDQPGSDTTWASRFYIEVSYRTPVSELSIDAWDIIEGSEVVMVGSRRLTRDTDYRIDYQTGVIRLYEQASVGEDEEIRVTCKHAGGLGSVSKTLLGGALLYQPEGSNFSMSTSWLYERKGSPDRRPRLGSEPTRIAVGEIATRYGRESMGLTRLLDQLPFLDARKASQISVEGGLGVSFPNPNTRNDLYIDDFEGVADDLYVRLNRMAWQSSSLPETGVAGIDESERAARSGETWWYTPYQTVQEGDLNPTLEYQEANDHRSVLELQLWPYTGLLEEGGALCPPEESWMGITQGLSRTNLDLTRARFLDIWVNDFVPWEEFVQDTSTRAGLMYVDIGQVSEDALWRRRPVDCATGDVAGGPQTPADRTLNTEDANRDGELDLSTETDEDTGLDNLEGVDPADGSFDDYEWTGDAEVKYETYEEVCPVYRKVNGTEKNGRLDSEDLDGDNSLDQLNSYFEFRVDLADSSEFLETDVRRDYAGRETNWTLDTRNGWRRIRIPLSDAYVHERVGDPSWDEVKHLRIWFGGASSWKRLQIGAIEIRSNRWIVEAIRDSAGTLVPPSELAVYEEDFFPGVYNNKENADVYVPPFIPHQDEQRADDRVPEREQSLTLEMRNFQPGHIGRVYESFLRDQDYTRYESLELWLNSTLPPDSEAEFFLRLCKDANADTTDFYEYRVPVPAIPSADRQTASWLPIKILLTDLSDLKAVEAGSDADVTRELADGGRIRMKGHPYLMRVRRITMGVDYRGPGPVSQANIWLDELRLTNVHKEVDYAMRMQVRTELSDFARLDFSYRQVGADFVSISGGGFSGRRERETSYALSTGNVPLGRLMPRQLDINLPFSFQQDWSRRVPKYRTNDDLLVGENPSDRDLTEQVNRSYSLGLSRQGGEGGLLRYTLDALRLSGSIREINSTNPQARDSTTTRTFSASYAFPFGQWGEIGLYKSWKLRLTPTSFGMAFTRSEKDQARYRREGGDLGRPFVLDDRRTVRSGGLSLAAALKPISAVNYDFKQSRDLMLRQEASWLGGLNIGQETSRQENLTANYQLRVKTNWLEPRLGWNSNFRGGFNRQGSTGGGGLERYNELTNGQARSIAWDLPLQGILDWLVLKGAPAGQPPAAPPPEVEAEGEDEEGQEDKERPEPPVPQTPQRNRQANPLRKWFSVGRTTASYSLSDGSTYNRVRGEPSLAYQLGLSMDPGVETLENFRESLVNSRQVKLDAEVTLIGVAVAAHFTDDQAETRSTGTVTGTHDRTFPELNVRWGDLTQKFGLKAYLRSFKANTRFLRKLRSSTRAGAAARDELSTQWSPLLDLELGFRSGVTATMRVDRTLNHSEDLTALKRIADRTDTRIYLSAKKSLSIVREITVPLTKNKERITSKLDLSLDFNLDSYRDVTQQVGYNPQVTADGRKLEFGVGGSYQFTRSVTGNMTLRYGENTDNKNRTRTMRYATVNLAASFSF